ncbi:MAG: LSM domain protein [Methanobrevibacter sp.]|jgi:small nuclear ribonucleoprotein (snRNP)-like protein|nr:LSM domain protein [Candidatus Methanoflexus mossambicus]
MNNFNNQTNQNNGNFQVNYQFARFKNKDVLISLKNREEIEGKIIAIDNYLNTVLQTKDGLNVIKGGKIVFISANE